MIILLTLHETFSSSFALLTSQSSLVWSLPCELLALTLLVPCTPGIDRDLDLN